jgi:hypothetical protein
MEARVGVNSLAAIGELVVARPFNARRLMSFAQVKLL